MVRLQIQLQPSQHREVKRRARRLGVSVSEVIRRCIEAESTAGAHDTRAERVRRALAVVGKYRDDLSTTTARDHEAALADAYQQ